MKQMKIKVFFYLNCGMKVKWMEWLDCPFNWIQRIQINGLLVMCGAATPTPIHFILSFLLSLINSRSGLVSSLIINGLRQSRWNETNEKNEFVEWNPCGADGLRPITPNKESSLAAPSLCCWLLGCAGHTINTPLFFGAQPKKKSWSCCWLRENCK